MFPYPLLLCDIGGTNARFSFAARPGARIGTLANLLTSDFAGLSEAASAALGISGMLPRSMLICAAGPVAGQSLRLTNSHWQIDGPAVAHKLGLKQGLLLNDFEALAFSLPELGSEDLLTIGPDMQNLPKDLPRLILGPGTGLGVAALLSIGGAYACIPSEAGHIDFPFAPGNEAHLFERVKGTHGRLTAENVLSGSGLVRLHRARLAAAGLHSVTAIDDPAEISQNALSDTDSQEAHTVRCFWELTGRFAGDMALTFSALGGVTLAGGILPKLRPLLSTGSFRRSFESKPPMQEMLRGIQTDLLLDGAAAQKGLRAIADHPEKYHINYAERRWA